VSDDDDDGSVAVSSALVASVDVDPGLLVDPGDDVLESAVTLVVIGRSVVDDAVASVPSVAPLPCAMSSGPQPNAATTAITSGPFLAVDTPNLRIEPMREIASCPDARERGHVRSHAEHASRFRVHSAP
jgi:hypothetical protein